MCRRAQANVSGKKIQHKKPVVLRDEGPPFSLVIGFTQVLQNIGFESLPKFGDVDPRQPLSLAAANFHILLTLDNNNSRISSTSLTVRDILRSGPLVSICLNIAYSVSKTPHAWICDDQ
jgi:hypothetical protein